MQFQNLEKDLCSYVNVMLCISCVWHSKSKSKTYLFLLQTGQSQDSWPERASYSRQLLHTRTLQPLRKIFLIIFVIFEIFSTCRRPPCWWSSQALPCSGHRTWRGLRPRSCRSPSPPPSSSTGRALLVAGWNRIISSQTTPQARSQKTGGSSRSVIN